MTFGEKARALLVADAATAAKVGGRVFFLALPQDVTTPAIRLLVVDDMTINSLEGYTSGLRNARVQVDCFAKKYGEAHEVADAVRRALGAVNEVDFGSMPISAGRDLYDDVAKLFWVTLDFSMWLNEEA